MARFAQYSRREEAPLADTGDLAFAGLDMRAPPLVPPGFVAEALNRRVVEGVYETRPGLFTPAWTRYCSDEWPYRSAYLDVQSAAYATAVGTATFGCATYSEPAGETWLVRVAARHLLFFRETEIGRIVEFSGNLEVTAPVHVFQNFNQLILVRGDDQASLVWGGAWTDRVLELVADSLASGYAQVPGAHYGLAWRERTVLLSGDDSLILTRIADSTQYATGVLFYVNRGRGDRLRAAVPLGSYALLVLKSQSLHVFSAPAAALNDARLDVQPIEMQFDSPMTAVAADNKVWWLDRRGVRTAEIAQVGATNQIVLSVDSTVSDRIAPLIRRINWRHASLFSAAVTTERIYFAVALDTQTAPQSLLVWNRLLGAWESLDQWAYPVAFDVLGWAPAVPWLAAPRLFAISSAGCCACLEYGHGEDQVGWVGTSALMQSAPLASRLVTRGYTSGTVDPKRFLRVQVALDTWHPGSIGLEARFDGPGEAQTMAPVTRDRTKYFTAAADFATTNADGRWHDPRRQDYSWVLQAPTPATPWVEGATYTLRNSTVVWPDNNRIYQAIDTHVATLGNTPDAPAGRGAEYWEKVEDSAPFSPAWTAGLEYSPGNEIYYASLGWRIRCRKEHTAQVGNSPLSSGSLWEYTQASNTTDLRTYLGAGIRLQDFQGAVERRDVQREAAWLQLAISATQGANRIRAISVEAQPGPRTNLTHT